MEIVIFGNSRTPAIDFTLDPVEGLKIRSRECFCLDYSGLKSTLSWREIFLRVTPVLDESLVYHNGKSGRFWRSWEVKPTKEILAALAEKVISCASSPPERTFLSQYIREMDEATDIDYCPALVPQAWVSWLHYRPDDSERVQTLRKQPLRVDFVCFYQDRKIVIEIDGWSHISDNHLSVDEGGRPAEGPSMLKYTEHLKKDRWLRKQGWEVHRFSTVEVEQDGARRLLEEIGVDCFMPF